MRILSKSIVNNQQTGATNVWVVRTTDPDLILNFNHDPSDAEILRSVPKGTSPVPSAKADWEDEMVTAYERWQMWKNTKTEAVARGLAAGIITALTNRENTAWNAYVTQIQSWNAAT